MSYLPNEKFNSPGAPQFPNLFVKTLSVQWMQTDKVVCGETDSSEMSYFSVSNLAHL